MPWWAELQRHMVVVVFGFVCVHMVCDILQHVFLLDCTELGNICYIRLQLQLEILPLLNWLDFCFKALLSSYSVMCSPGHNKLPFALKASS